MLESLPYIYLSVVVSRRECHAAKQKLYMHLFNRQHLRISSIYWAYLTRVVLDVDNVYGIRAKI